MAEKWTDFRDSRTGIQPMISSKRKKSIFAYILIFPVALVRIILLVIVSLWLLLHTFIGSIIPLRLLGRWYLRWTQAQGARVILFLLGFHYIKTVVQPAPFTKTKTKSKTASSNSKSFFFSGPCAESGDVVVSNYVSFVQHLFLAWRYAPTFGILSNHWPPTTPSSSTPSSSTLNLGLDSCNNLAEYHALLKDRNAKGAVVNIPPPPLATGFVLDTKYLPKAIFNEFGRGLHGYLVEHREPDIKNPQQKWLDQVLHECKTNKYGPLVLFPEGATTTGTGMLQWLPVLKRLPKGTNVHLIAFHVSIPFTQGSLLSYIWDLITNWNNSMDVFYLFNPHSPSPDTSTSTSINPLKIPQNIKMLVCPESSSDPELEYSNMCAGYICKALGFKMVSWTANDKFRFNQLYTQSFLKSK